MTDALTDPRSDLGKSPPLVLIGGSGRSGTHAISELLDRHPRYEAVPIEARFHAKPRGFPDLLAGEVSRDEFVHKLRNFWWQRIPAGSFMPALMPRTPLGRGDRGLHRLMNKDRFDAAVDRFEAAYADDAAAACRALFLELLWPIAAEPGRPGLVEMTTDNVIQGATLSRLFPEAKFVLTVRDGRDAGSSKVARRQRSHHPTEAFSGVDWWLERMRRVEAGLAAIPPGRVHVVVLDLLVGDARDELYAGLLRFLDLPDKPRIHRYFDAKMNPRRAHRERWREGLDDGEQASLTDHYLAALDELETAGSRTAPLLRAALT